MHTLEQARTLISSSAPSLGFESIPLPESLFRVLAQDIHSDTDLPAFSASAMDGYACRKADLGLELRIVDQIRAGQMPSRSIGPGECAEIMTGAPVPSGADFVVPYEQAEEKAGNVRVLMPSSSSNIREKAEDISAGDLILRKGTRITPPIMAVLASVGCASVPAAKKPVVAVMATGDELVPPSQKPGPSKIRDSNTIQLTAQVAAAGGRPETTGITGDEPAALRRQIEKALGYSDVVLISGGVSEGRFDFVPQVLQELGVKILVKGIAVKPGRPLVFGMHGKKAIFGMPGNPNATFVLFELLVKPYIQGMMGCVEPTRLIQAKLKDTITRKNSDREEFRPVRYSNGIVEKIPYNGSAHIHSYTPADAILSIPISINRLEAGTEVIIRCLF